VSDEGSQVCPGCHKERHPAQFGRQPRPDLCSDCWSAIAPTVETIHHVNVELPAMRRRGRDVQPDLVEALELGSPEPRKEAVMPKGVWKCDECQEEMGTRLKAQHLAEHRRARRNGDPAERPAQASAPAAAPATMEACPVCIQRQTAAEKALLATLIRSGLEVDAAMTAISQARAVYGGGRQT
jgi:hypothetical protein